MKQRVQAEQEVVLYILNLARLSVGRRVVLALSEWVTSVIFLPSQNIGIKLASSAAQVQKTNIIITQNDHCKCSEKFFQLSMVLLIHQHSWNEHMILRAFLLRPPIWNKTFWNITLCSCRRKYLLAWVGFLYVNLPKLQKYQTPPTLPMSLSYPTHLLRHTYWNRNP